MADNFDIIGENLLNYAIVVRGLVDTQHSDQVLLVYGIDFIDNYYCPTLRGQLVRLLDLSSAFTLFHHMLDTFRVA